MLLPIFFMKHDKNKQTKKGGGGDAWGIEQLCSLHVCKCIPAYTNILLWLSTSTTYIYIQNTLCGTSVHTYTHVCTHVYAHCVYMYACIQICITIHRHRYPYMHIPTASDSEHSCAYIHRQSQCYYCRQRF